MSAAPKVSESARFLGLPVDEFFTKLRSLADVRSHVDLVIKQPAQFAVAPKNAERVVAWLTDFRDYKFEEQPLNIFPQTKIYRYCGITIPVHSPLESLAYAMSLIEPPDDAATNNWYELWAVCIARMIGTASPGQAPVTLSLIYPSPRFELPPAWDAKYLVGTSISMRLVDDLGQLMPEKEEADQKREMVRWERCQFAISCGVTTTPGQSANSPYFESKNGFGQIVGLCAQHMPSCVILKTIPPKHATQFKRLAVNVDPITNTQDVSTEPEGYWGRFFKDTCVNCIDGYCNPAGFAASSRSRSKRGSS